MTGWYEAEPGTWLLDGVTLEEHRIAMADNWDGGMFDEPKTPRPQATETHWVTGEGQYVEPSDMSDKHVNNTILFLRRKGRHLECPTYGALMYEAGKRGLALEAVMVEES